MPPAHAGAGIRARLLLAACLVCLLCAGAGAPAEEPRLPLEKAFAQPRVRREMQRALAGMIRSAVPDPKNEFAGFLPKTGFALIARNRRADLWVIENPHGAFLRRVAALHDDSEAVEKFLRLSREEEPERIRRLASYTIQRVLERLERDREEKKLSDAARRDIVRAAIEELVATASIDAGNLILEEIQAAIRRRGVDDQRLLGYGFSLVEYDEPNSHEWDALRGDGRLFCLRFSPKGFKVYAVGGEKEQVYSFTTRTWMRDASRLINLRPSTSSRGLMGLADQ